jgi:pyruvate dehydrogenase E1 component alpha subunit
MMAELLGRIGGTNKGKGGSQHVADMRKGMLGANAIVAGSVPLAVGAALKAKYRGEDSLSVAFFGDGAANQGVVHESMNLASIWKLPVLFVCENNGYGQSTPSEYATSVDDIAKRASSYSMPGIVVDGMDVFAVYEEAAQLVKRSRAGEGPALLECKTYRFYGHYTGDDTRMYRLPEEEERWQKRDPVELFREHVLREESLVEGDLDEIQAEVMALIEEAVTYADQSDFPPVEELLTDVYVSYPMRELYRGTGLPIVRPFIDTTQVESSPHHGGKP